MVGMLFFSGKPQDDNDDSEEKEELVGEDAGEVGGSGGVQSAAVDVFCVEDAAHM